MDDIREIALKFCLEPDLWYCKYKFRGLEYGRLFFFYVSNIFSLQVMHFFSIFV